MKIQEKVAEQISKSGTSVEEIVVKKLVDLEVNNRVEIIAKGIQKLDQLEKELKKIDRCDQKAYVGGQVQESMSEKRFNDIKKIKDNISRLSKAIDSALEKNEADLYKKVTEATGGNNNEIKEDKGE